MAATGCGRGPERASTASLPRPLHVDVRADSAAGYALHVAPPPVRVSLQRVTAAPAGSPPPPASAAPARAVQPEPPLPEAAPDTLPAPPASPSAAAPAATHAVLEPPVLRAGATLIAPPRLRRPAVVELDVLVDAFGQVSDVRWAAGSRDTALVTAAERCASTMRFDPARLAGRPVDAWCRQRFEFGKR